MVDTRDLKSLGRKAVGFQAPPRALISHKHKLLRHVAYDEPAFVLAAWLLLLLASETGYFSLEQKCLLDCNSTKQDWLGDQFCCLCVF